MLLVLNGLPWIGCSSLVRIWDKLELGIGPVQVRVLPAEEGSVCAEELSTAESHLFVCSADGKK